jgi:hypothetical protein
LLSDLPDATPVVVGQAGAEGRTDPGNSKWLIVSDYGSPTFRLRFWCSTVYPERSHLHQC